MQWFDLSLQGCHSLAKRRTRPPSSLRIHCIHYLQYAVQITYARNEHDRRSRPSDRPPECWRGKWLVAYTSPEGPELVTLEFVSALYIHLHHTRNVTSLSHHTSSRPPKCTPNGRCVEGYMIAVSRWHKFWRKKKGLWILLPKTWCDVMGWYV